MAPPLEKFFRKVNKTETCWLWTARVDDWGYGRHKSTHGPSTVLAYRWLWEVLNGPVPDGLELDHLCRVPACVRPDHLEAVTPKVNGLRSNNFSAVNARKTHCIHGHEFTFENTYTRPSGGRDCRECLRERRRQHEARRRAHT
ncbi:MAG: HNH endonuclease [Nonomuraea sp.]|nr:HNH endonuclease [Nonomuraea sp.]NUQ33274.1 HNH endonuclease [Dermatophilaceae bacterium]NUR81092.1 HNH endonuclease [Dermatophilaceae bacterium]